MKKTPDLLFANLFQKALKELPEIIILELKTQEFDEIVTTGNGYNLVRYKNLAWNKDLENYVVKDLYDLCESKESKYYDHYLEVLIVNLYSVIYVIIFESARYLTSIEIKYIRPEIVQYKFEKILNEGLAKQRDDWRANDVQLIKDYFAVNYPEDDDQKT